MLTKITPGAACDLMNVFFVFDEQTDEENEARTRKLADIVIHAVRHPERLRPSGEPVVGEITWQFLGARHRGLDGFEQGTLRGRVDALRRFGRDAGCGPRRGAPAHDRGYLELQRYTIGADPSYALAMLRVDLTLELLGLRFFHKPRRCIADMLIFDKWRELMRFSQDLPSYCKEYAVCDHMHNIIVLVINEKHLELDGAVAWLAAERAKRVNEFSVLWFQASSMSFGSFVLLRAQYVLIHEGDSHCNYLAFNLLPHLNLLSPGQGRASAAHAPPLSAVQPCNRRGALHALMV